MTWFTEELTNIIFCPAGRLRLRAREGKSQKDDDLMLFLAT